MNNERSPGSEVLDILGDQFLLLMHNLVRGNMKRALRHAEAARREAERSGMSIASQSLIEELAQAQAVKNSIINSPSIVPGIGTLLSFWLLSVENFFLLDQSVTLIIALCDLHGIPVDGSRTHKAHGPIQRGSEGACSVASSPAREEGKGPASLQPAENRLIERFAVEVVAEVFGIGTIERKEDLRAVSKEYITKTLPKKYMNSGVSSGVRKLLRRLLPFKSRSRLLPAGIGIGASALSAYETLVNIGQTTMKNIPKLVRDDSNGA